jgi:hypothetical protein
MVFFVKKPGLKGRAIITESFEGVDTYIFRPISRIHHISERDHGHIRRVIFIIFSLIFIIVIE